MDATMGIKAAVAGTQAAATFMKTAMVEAEQEAQAILSLLPDVSPSVNPPHLGKSVDTRA